MLFSPLIFVHMWLQTLQFGSARESKKWGIVNKNNIAKNVANTLLFDVFRKFVLCILKQMIGKAETKDAATLVAKKK